MDNIQDIESFRVRRMKVGERAWFGVESKTFEILVELSKGKLFGVITERG